MVTQIFLNLCIKDLKKSVEFFTQLGFTFNPQFTDENATCMIIGENIFAMLITEPLFKTFTKKEIANAHKTTEVLIALSTESRDKVDELVNNAMKAGATSRTDTQDLGWMYQRSFADPDGHHWEIFYMDINAMPKA